MAESKWQRMKRKSFEAGRAAGYFEAFDKWYEGKVEPMEKIQHGIVKGCRQSMLGMMFSSSVSAREPIMGIRQVLK